MFTLSRRKCELELVKDVSRLGHAISHGNVLFVVDLDLSVNYVFSIIIYYI